MKPQKAKASKQPAKKPAKKQASMSKKPAKGNAPAKGNDCKWQAPDKSDDSDSDDEVAQARPKWKQQKKTKHIKTEDVSEEEIEVMEPEEIVEWGDDEVESEEELEGNNDRVSKQVWMIIRNNDSPSKRMMYPRTPNTNLIFPLNYMWRRTQQKTC